MSDTKDGGPTFPATRPERVRESLHGQTHIKVEYPGMSLRDWFAGHAMEGMISARPDNASWDDLAKFAYVAADAMLAERSAKPQS